MHKLEEMFWNLVAEQPQEFSFVKKCQRIDKRACFELETEISVNQSLSPDWFTILSVIINSVYCDTYPQLRESVTYRESILYLCYLSRTDEMGKISYKDRSRFVKEYISLRREVLEELKFLHEDPSD